MSRLLVAFFLSALLAVLALALAFGLPTDPAPTPMPGDGREEMVLALRTPVFRAILLISTIWNVGLFAFLAALLSYTPARGLDAAVMVASCAR